MKKLSFTWILAFILSVGHAQNYSFSEVCETGQILYNKIVSDSVNYTVEVVAPNNNTVPYWDEEFVKSIGEVAFYDCTGITSVSLPSALESIEFDA